MVDDGQQRKLEHALRLAATGVSGRTGSAFFESFVQYVAEALGSDMALVGRSNIDRKIVDTIAVWKDGGLRENFQYRLDVSPCRNVVGQKVCVYCNGVWRDFPDDRPLAEARMNGYVGAPLFDSNQAPIGLIAVLFREPIGQPEFCENLLRIFAARAAGELERMDNERALKASEQMFKDFASASADQFWATDRNHRFSYLSDWVERVAGVKAEDILGKTRWELAGVDFEHDPYWLAHIETLRHHREFRDFRYRFTNDKGRVVHVSVSGTPVFDEEGEFTGYRGTASNVTDRVRAEEKERESQYRLNLAMDASRLFAWDWEIGSEHTRWTPDPAPLLGRKSGDHYPDFKTMVHPDDLEEFLAAHTRCLETGAPYASLFRLRGTDGRLRWLSARGILLKGADDRPERMIGITQDITAEKEIEEHLRISATVFETREAIMITDTDASILDVNTAFQELTGYSKPELLGRSPGILRSGHHDREFYKAFWTELKENGHWQGELWVRTKTGEVMPLWVTINAVVDEHDNVYRYVATYTDLSERKQAEKRIEKLANFDVLTDLPNRRSITSAIKREIERCTLKGRVSGVLLMDLDGFRTINESLGYQVGDEVLCRVADVIKEQVGNKDVVARIGADEFAVLILDAGVDRTEAMETLKAMANRIMAAISRPVRVRGNQLYLSFSMGINSFPDGSEGAEDVLAKSEVAMHQARQEGFGSSRFYRPKMKHRADQRLVLQNQLSAALQSNRLKNVYQSQVDVNGRIIGVEALARLMLPDGRILEPDQFISVAEETGVIVPLGYAVLNQALFDMRWWLTRSLNPPEFVAVNVCPKQFLRDGFVESVKEALEFNRVSGQHLELEITENLLVADFDRVEQIMHALNELGVRFVIDDFGAGHSSLAYLKRLPIDKLKIDRSFIQGVGTDESSNAIVAAVVSMGQALGLAVVAEGVQSDEIKACLLERGCTIYQGFLFDEPVPSEIFAASL